VVVLQVLSDLAAIAPMVVTVCSIIAAVTPTPQDDAWMAKLYKFIDILAINIGKAKH
jgi:hypothetical protein